MAKVKFQGDKYAASLKKTFSKFQKDTKELNKAATAVLREIKADTRDGKGYDNKSLPRIKSATKERRARLSEFNRTSRFFKSSFSNATFMGDTVNKITAKVKKGVIEIFGKGKHSRMKGVRGKTLEGSDASISSILENLSDLGYNILGVSKRSKKKISIQFKRWLRRNL